MTPAAFITTVLVPGLTWLTSVVGPKPGLAIDWESDDSGRLLMLAMAGQESEWQDIQQAGGGPGRGFFQDEPETCSEVLNNPASSVMMHKVCAALNIPATRSSIYASLLRSPSLQVALARLDLWCNPHVLPPYGDEAAAWEYYLATWRPGAPSRSRWSEVYPQALAADKAWMAGQNNEKT